LFHAFNMKNRKSDPTITDSIELPKIIPLSETLYAVVFPLMKLLPARFILDQAKEAGQTGPGATIIETTSGTFGLALSMLCALRGYRLILVSDPAIDDSLKRRMEDLGTRVEIVRKPAAVGGYQRARLDRMAELQAEYPDHFWPSQYDNPYNPGAYAPVAELIVETLNSVDCLVGTVGSGGSVCGTSKYLRLLYPQLTVIGVDTLGSVLFGQPDKKRILRGLGNSLMPQNVDHTVFDEIHWVTAAEAFLATRMLHRRYALFMGGTSGAAYMVGKRWSLQNPEAKVAILLPDEGYRYQDTVYNDDWLRSNGLWLAALPSSPDLVTHPEEAGPNWTRILWARRTFEEVTGRLFQAQEVYSSGALKDTG
jgi:cysteine synthase A